MRKDTNVKIYTIQIEYIYKNKIAAKTAYNNMWHFSNLSFSILWLCVFFSLKSCIVQPFTVAYRYWEIFVCKCTLYWIVVAIDWISCSFLSPHFDWLKSMCSSSHVNLKYTCYFSFSAHFSLYMYISWLVHTFSPVVLKTLLFWELKRELT